MPRQRACLFSALALSALTAAAADPPQTPVILISIDTLRADHLSAYGYRKIATPHIDAFAEHGTLFSSIDSQIPLTLPSHTSLFTSTYPFQNRIEENEQHVPPGTVTLASVLKAHGYKTAAFAGSALLGRQLGLDQGFDFYDSPFSIYSGAAENPYSVRVRRDGALVIRAARQWLDANRGQPVFAFLHFFDLHAPYSQAPAGATQVAGYDAELEYVDQLMGRFQQALQQSGWWDRALVILLADHGESLGEHGEANHGYFAYQSTLWVPLIVHWPAARGNTAGRVSQPGGLIDVAPTVLDFLGIPAPPSFEGDSLLARLKAADGGRRPVLSESVYARDAFRWAPVRTLRVGAFQYIAAPKPELYNLVDDPGERTNLIRKEPAEAAARQIQLSQLLARYAPRQPAPAAGISPESRVLLGSLGYIGGGPGVDGKGAGPDPKDRLPEYNLYEKALTFMYSAKPEAAISGFREVLKLDAHNTLCRYYLGEALLRAGKPDDALREWTAALANDPEYAPADEAIGTVWMARQDYAKAKSYFQQALAVAPGDAAALWELGTAEEKLGAFKDAVEHLQTACGMMPESEQCERELRVAEEKAKGR